MFYVIGLVFSLFMGMTGISLGFGALYPPINGIAQPIVCPDGEMNYNRRVSHPLPGRTYIQASWVCVDRSGKSTPIDNLTLSLCAGTFYGLVLFVVGAIVVRLRGSSRTTRGS